MAELSQKARGRQGWRVSRAGYKSGLQNVSVEAQIGQNVALQTKRKRSFQFCNPIL
jgi:hypothetical protein